MFEMSCFSSYNIQLVPDPVLYVHFVFHQTNVVIQSTADVCCDLFSQLVVVVISFGRCDQIAAVVEVGVAVIFMVITPHFGCSPMDALPINHCRY